MEHPPTWHRRRGSSQVVMALFGLSIIGCSSNRTSTFQVVDYRQRGVARRYRESFNEGYYDTDGQGDVNIVLRRVVEGREGPGHNITQVVHLHTVWRSIPGETVAHDTQINGTVGYYIITGRTGAAFEGAGSIFYRQNRRKPVITGTLDIASLKPTRQLTVARDLFKRAELSGRFRAEYNPRQVVRIIHDMNRRFGSTSSPSTSVP